MKHVFDLVWHHGLIGKLHDVRISILLINVMHSFLTERMQYGVLQGSAITPLLHSLYRCELCLTQKTQTALYADDVTIYALSFHSQTVVAKV